ncbi:MAG: type II toxin-antitoxin system PemK/MazF family toxin [Candidatus Eremiobacteraeota bacterium]|nr:type II toxin-antitoxin system PemK/MazF family toxin [Candidatus Eremiobacteraeota bacterium]MBC5803394.1 type II toxin-antitoxin system PemK/MazF family toxin [Candidatus Eremiobacteraeota bacterium]MBC5822514.1 type II toxin-antitoxin system PemK/MazF family toxin [Candidatus Eremiobacteraeota bacterium]
MTAGQIVTVDWRDALPDSGEADKRRPAVVVGAPPTFGSTLPFELVVPLTGEAAYALPGTYVTLEPTPENGCTKACFALAWCVQNVPHARLSRTPSRVTDTQLRLIRTKIAACLGVSPD